MALLAELVAAVERTGVDLRALGLAWARVSPSMALIPAFGLRAMPGPARATMALALAASIAPALSQKAAAATMPWPFALGVEAAKGIPVAVTASIALWVATMAGGVIDDLRGARETASLPHVDAGSTPMGALFAMLIAVAFLEGGGPARVAAALARPDLALATPFARAAVDLSSGIEIAIAVATPVLLASVVIEVAGALVSRAASPAYISPLLAPLRSIALLGIVGLVLERIVELMSVLANRPL